MNYILVLLCVPCYGIGFGHEVSDSLLIGNTSQIGGVVDSTLDTRNDLTDIVGSDNQKFNMAALISTLADLSIDPDAMLNVITLLSHMIYQASSTLDEIEGTIATETANMAAAQAQADAIINSAQALLDAAVARRDSEQPVLNDEISMLRSVINTLGGDHLQCLQGLPADECGRARVWGNEIERQNTQDECLDAQRAQQDYSAATLGILYEPPTGRCLTYDVQLFDQCPNISWQQSDFTVQHDWRVCRVWIE